MQAYNSQNSQIEAEAAQWLARLGDKDPSAAGPERERELVDWLQQSPEHVRAFLAASDAFFRLDGLAGQTSAAVRTLIDGASSNVALLPLAAPTVKPNWRRWSFPAAATLAAATIGGAWLAGPGLQGKTYSTAVGEQRTVKLEDGSFVHLNTRSRIEVDFSSKQRRIELKDGEALFTVEQDGARPFVVQTGAATVQALGTAFNVYKRTAEVQVAVVEGRVQVGTANALEAPASVGRSAPLVLSAGEEARVAEGRVSKTPSAVSDAIAWRQRRLVFRDTPLAEVAAEFNRYNKSRMRVEGEALKAKPLTGVFSADHPQSLILYLSEFNSLEVTQEDGDWVVRTP